MARSLNRGVARSLNRGVARSLNRGVARSLNRGVACFGVPTCMHACNTCMLYFLCSGRNSTRQINGNASFYEIQTKFLQFE